MRWKFQGSIYNTRTRTKTSSVSSVSFRTWILFVALEFAIVALRSGVMTEAFIHSPSSIRLPDIVGGRRGYCNSSEYSTVFLRNERKVGGAILASTFHS